MYYSPSTSGESATRPSQGTLRCDAAAFVYDGVFLGWLRVKAGVGDLEKTARFLLVAN